jgi:hypothetical protein
MRAQDPVLLARGQRLGRGQLIAGFEVSINCRFWVSTEVKPCSQVFDSKRRDAGVVDQARLEIESPRVY